MSGGGMAQVTSSSRTVSAQSATLLYVLSGHGPPLVAPWHEAQRC